MLQCKMFWRSATLEACRYRWDTHGHTISISMTAFHRPVWSLLFPVFVYLCTCHISWFPFDFVLFMRILEYSWISHMSSHCGGVLCPRWNLLGPYMSCAPCPPKPKSQHTKSLKGVCPSQYPMVERCWGWSTRHVWKWSHGWKTIQFSWSKVIPLWFLFWCFTVSYIELVYYGIWFICAPSLMLNRLPLSILFARNCTHSTEDMQHDSNDWSMVEQIHVCAGLYMVFIVMFVWVSLPLSV